MAIIETSTPTLILVGLSRTPMVLRDLDRPSVRRDDWAVAKTRLTGICGSDAKMVFMDFGDDFGASALNGYFTFPPVFGHEVVADVVEVVDRAGDLAAPFQERGQAVE